MLWATYFLSLYQLKHKNIINFIKSNKIHAKLYKSISNKINNLNLNVGDVNISRFKKQVVQFKNQFLNFLSKA